MRFKEFLVEKAMNMKTFGDVKKRLGTTAKVGFEFEMVVPEHSRHHTTDKPDYNRSTMYVKYLDSRESYEDFFDGPRGVWRQISRDYEDWAEQQDDKDQSDFSHWLESEFDNNYKFCQQYDLEPKYGWYSEEPKRATLFTEPRTEESEVSGTMDNAQKELRDIVDGIVNVSQSYHGERKNNKEWYLEPDGSIKDDGKGGHGMELVSPPLLLDNAMKELDRVFHWMIDSDIETNDSTGLHINVSVPDLNDKLDPVKLVLFMGEDYAKEIFNRADNKYTSSQIDVVLDRVKEDGLLPPSVNEMIAAVKKHLAQDKNRTVNLSKMSAGYLEFRAAGGHDYHKDIDKVKKTVYRFITAVEIACDPNAERQEYIKKLTKLFNKAGDGMQDITRYDINELPGELHRLYKYNPEIMKAWKLFDKGLTAGGTSAAGRVELLNLIKVAMKTVKNFKTHLELNERVFFKRKIKEAALQAADVDKIYASDPVARLEFKKQIGI